MTNYATMHGEFERQKNRKATAITSGITLALILLFIFLKWPLPSFPEPEVQEFIEVNLGSGDLGSGTDQPLLPGMPAPSEQTAYTPPAPVQSNVSDVKAVETDDRVTNDAPSIKTPPVSKPNATRIDNDNKVNRATPTPQPVVSEAPPRPRAVMGRTTGSNGNGGNGADTYRPGTGEGIAGGTGDQGRPGGSPDGRDYTGTPRQLTARVVSIPAASFEDDFNESGKVALDIQVNENGKLVNASYQPKGSTLPRSSKQTSIALQRAREIRYPQMEGGFKQTITFVFNVN